MKKSRHVIGRLPQRYDRFVGQHVEQNALPSEHVLHQFNRLIGGKWHLVLLPHRDVGMSRSAPNAGVATVQEHHGQAD